MHRMTFPMPARVSLDAAGVLTDAAAESGGGGPKIPVHQVFLPCVFASFFKMKRR